MNAALRHSTRHAADVVRSAAAFLYPPVCARCSAPPAGPAVHLASRKPMVSALPQPADAADHRALLPVQRPDRDPYLDTNSACIHCRGDRFAFERAFSIGIYDGLLRESCLAAKQPGGHTTAAALSDLLVHHQGNALRQQQLDLVVPLPHHWRERLARSHLPPDVIAPPTRPDSWESPAMFTFWPKSGEPRPNQVCTRPTPPESARRVPASAKTPRSPAATSCSSTTS